MWGSHETPMDENLIQIGEILLVEGIAFEIVKRMNNLQSISIYAWSQLVNCRDTFHFFVTYLIYVQTLHLNDVVLHPTERICQIFLHYFLF